MAWNDKMKKLTRYLCVIVLVLIMVVLRQSSVTNYLNSMTKDVAGAQMSIRRISRGSSDPVGSLSYAAAFPSYKNSLTNAQKSAYWLDNPVVQFLTKLEAIYSKFSLWQKNHFEGLLDRTVDGGTVGDQNGAKPAVQQSEMHMPRCFLAIKTAPAYQERRDVMRSTWLRQLQEENSHAGYNKFEYRFFADKPQEDTAEALHNESQRHNDTIILPVVTTRERVPRQLGEKMVAMFDYVETHFQNASHLILLDDDVYVNVTMLVDKCDTWPLQKLVTGLIFAGSPVLHFEEEESLKFGEVGFPLDMFPPYPSGIFVAFSKDVIPAFTRTLLPLRLMVNDDAMIGVVLLGYNVTLISDRTIFPNGLDEGGCRDEHLAIHLSFNNPLLAHEVDLLHEIHRNTTEGLLLCGDRYSEEKYRFSQEEDR